MQNPSSERDGPQRFVLRPALRLVTGGHVEGTLRWLDGCEVPVGRVRFCSPGQAPVEIIAIQGRFSAHDLPPGPCRLEVMVGRRVLARRVMVPGDGGVFVEFSVRR